MRAMWPRVLLVLFALAIVGGACVIKTAGPGRHRAPATVEHEKHKKQKKAKKPKKHANRHERGLGARQ